MPSWNIWLIDSFLVTSFYFGKPFPHETICVITITEDSGWRNKKAAQHNSPIARNLFHLSLTQITEYSYNGVKFVAILFFVLCLPPFSHILLVKVAVILDIAGIMVLPTISAADISFLLLQWKKQNKHTINTSNRSLFYSSWKESFLRLCLKWGRDDREVAMIGLKTSWRNWVKDSDWFGF